MTSENLSKSHHHIVSLNQMLIQYTLWPWNDLFGLHWALLRIKRNFSSYRVKKQIAHLKFMWSLSWYYQEKSGPKETRPFKYDELFSENQYLRKRNGYIIISKRLHRGLWKFSVRRSFRLFFSTKPWLFLYLPDSMESFWDLKESCWENSRHNNVLVWYINVSTVNKMTERGNVYHWGLENERSTLTKQMSNFMENPHGVYWKHKTWAKKPSFRKFFFKALHLKTYVPKAVSIRHLASAEAIAIRLWMPELCIQKKLMHDVSLP